MSQLSDVQTVLEHADALYAAYQQGLLIEKEKLKEAASYNYMAYSKLSEENAKKTAYINQALELDRAFQHCCLRAPKQKELEEKEQRLTQQVMAIRESTAFQALKNAMFTLYQQVGNTNGSFLAGKKPTWVEALYRTFRNLDNAAPKMFKKSLQTLVELAKESIRRHPAARALFEAANHLYQTHYRHLPNQYKRGTVSP